jgi:hypothetical protein
MSRARLRGTLNASPQTVNAARPGQPLVFKEKGERFKPLACEFRKENRQSSMTSITTIGHNCYLQLPGQNVVDHYETHQEQHQYEADLLEALAHIHRHGQPD